MCIYKFIHIYICFRRARARVCVCVGGGGVCVCAYLNSYTCVYIQYVTSFHKKGLLVIRQDTANYKPASRGAESMSEETLFLRTCYRLLAAPLELTAVYQISCVALMSLTVAGVCLVACQRVALRRVHRQVSAVSYCKAQDWLRLAEIGLGTHAGKRSSYRRPARNSKV